jgi:hypothetical protein
VAIRTIACSSLDITFDIVTRKRRESLWDHSIVDRVISRKKDVEEKVKSFGGCNDPDIANANTLSAIFDRKLHSWPRNP